MRLAVNIAPSKSYMYGSRPEMNISAWIFVVKETVHENQHLPAINFTSSLKLRQVSRSSLKGGDGLIIVAGTENIKLRLPRNDD
jgi:hypothetical protein